MNITDVNCSADPSVHSMDLAIEQTGLLGITVKAGPVTFHGVADALDADDLFTATDRQEDTDVIAYICKDTQDNDNIVVLVDEVVLDGVDVPYSYQRGDQYELIAMLYTIRIPGNTSDLTNIALNRHTIKEA